MTGRLYGADTELLSERLTGLVHVVLGSVSLSGSKETGVVVQNLPSFSRCGRVGGWRGGA